MTNKYKHSYIDIVLEMRLNTTENRQMIEELMKKIIYGKIEEDQRHDGLYLIIRQSGIDHLQVLHDWIIEEKQLDTVRRRLLRTMQDNITTLSFNRQAAAMDRIALVDFNDDPPLGPLMIQIISDEIFEIIDILAPQTEMGKQLSMEEMNQRRLMQHKKAQERRETIDKNRMQREKFEYLD